MFRCYKSKKPQKPKKTQQPYVQLEDPSHSSLIISRRKSPVPANNPPTEVQSSPVSVQTPTFKHQGPVYYVQPIPIYTQQPEILHPRASFTDAVLSFGSGLVLGDILFDW